MALPDPLLLSDLLRHRVRCDQGLDHGLGVMAWMHPPVHRLLGWVSRHSALRNSRAVWRLDQCRGLDDQQVFVQGSPAETDQRTLERLPTLMEADLLDRQGAPEQSEQIRQAVAKLQADEGSGSKSGNGLGSALLGGAVSTLSALAPLALKTLVPGGIGF